MKKTRQTKGQYTIVDTYNSEDFYPRELYAEYREDNGMEGEFDDYDYFTWARDMAQEDLQDFLENLKYDKELKFVPVIVEGTLGLWWGRPEIEQRLFPDARTAILACIDSAYDVIIKKKGHRLEVINLHHDGRSYFNLTFLSYLGEHRYNRHGAVSTRNRENIHKLQEYLF
jgi:hypothetical protein